MGYKEPGIRIDTEEPIEKGERGRVWKASGGKSGFKATSETVFVDYDPDEPEGEQFTVGTVTPGGVGRKDTYGTKAEAVAAAKERAEGLLNDFSDL